MKIPIFAIDNILYLAVLLQGWQYPAPGYYVAGLASYEHFRTVGYAVKILVFANGNILYQAILLQGWQAGSILGQFGMQ